MGKWSYAVVLDAGSSGTRVYLYRWEKPAAHPGRAPSTRLPRLEAEAEWSKKTSPGVSSFNKDSSTIGPDHLQPLFDHALAFIEPDEVPNTPVFLLATAGMRLLPAHERDTILQSICDYTTAHTPFLLPDCSKHIQVIPGDTEGLFGWMTANYLIGGFDEPEKHRHGKGHHTYGFLDMGGASSQIAFVPNATETERHGDDLTLLRLRTLDGKSKDYRVFSTTWLGAGVNQARERYVKMLLDSDAGDEGGTIQDPCLPAGLELEAHNPDGTSASRTLVGTGDFPECERAAYPLLGKNLPCPDAPCLIHGVHTPALDFDVHHFVGVSEYWYSTHGLFDLGKSDPQYEFAKYQADVNALCSRPWEDLLQGLRENEWGDPHIDEEKLGQVCFKASWLTNVLHEGIGVPKIYSDKKAHLPGFLLPSNRTLSGYFPQPFKAVNQISDREVSWTLGKVLLYASAQIPAGAMVSSAPAEVGYGPNVPGVESSPDWVPGSLSQLATPPLPSNKTADWQDIPDLFDYNPRRTPGMILFGCLFVLMLYWVIGRARRRSLYTKVGALFSAPPDNSGPGGPAGPRRPLFRSLASAFTPSSRHRSRQSYSAVPDLEDPTTFELEVHDSDGSQSSSSPGSVQRGRPAAHRVSSSALGNGAASSSASMFDVTGPGPGRGMVDARTGSMDFLTLQSPGGRVRSRQASPVRSRRGS